MTPALPQRLLAAPEPTVSKPELVTSLGLPQAAFAPVTLFKNGYTEAGKEEKGVLQSKRALPVFLQGSTFTPHLDHSTPVKHIPFPALALLGSCTPKSHSEAGAEPILLLLQPQLIPPPGQHQY